MKLALLHSSFKSGIFLCLLGTLIKQKFHCRES